MTFIKKISVFSFWYRKVYSRYHCENCIRLLPKAIFLLFIFINVFNSYAAEEFQPFLGQINTDNINIRTDSTVSSEIICKLNQGDRVEVISRVYDWYKIRLPYSAPSFIRKDLVAPIDNKTANGSTTLGTTVLEFIEGRSRSAKVLKDRVNIRMHPDTSSPILGKANKDDVVNILQERQDWYKIEPLKDSFGWLHKKFVQKLEEPSMEFTHITQKSSQGIDNKDIVSDKIVVEGTIRPKVIKRIATHKLIAKDNKVFLLKGDKIELASFNNRQVRITGRLINSSEQEPTIIEFEKIEASD